MEEEQLNPIQRDIVFNTRLTDVNVDCLELIFKLLTFEDLLNLADSTKELRPTLDLFVTGQLKKKWLMINPSTKMIVLHDGQLESRTPIPWSLCFKLIRCFGHLITKLVILYAQGRNAKLATHIDRYVNEYCADSLLEFELYDSDENTLKTIQKPFKSVETLRFAHCRLGNKLSQLDKWFPNVRCLTFSGRTVLSKIGAKFSGLQELSVELPFQEYGYSKILTELLRPNPNLRSLYLSGIVSIGCLRYIGENIVEVEIDCAITVHDVITFTNKCTALKKFTFILKHGDAGNILKNLLGDGWRIDDNNRIDYFYPKITMER